MPRDFMFQPFVFGPDKFQFYNLIWTFPFLSVFFFRRTLNMPCDFMCHHVCLSFLGLSRSNSIINLDFPFFPEKIDGYAL